MHVLYAFSLSFFETGPYYVITPLPQPPELRNSRNDSQFLDLLLFSLYSKTNEKKVLGILIILQNLNKKLMNGNK